MMFTNINNINANDVYYHCGLHSKVMYTGFRSIPSVSGQVAKLPSSVWEHCTQKQGKVVMAVAYVSIKEHKNTKWLLT